MHLIIDGADCDKARLESIWDVTRFLADMPERLGMKRISPVQVVALPNGEDDKHGVSGMVMIAESHLTVHTWPEYRAVWIDLFSCRDFDAEAVTEHVAQVFGIRAVDATTLDRGVSNFVSSPWAGPHGRED